MPCCCHQRGSHTNAVTHEDSEFLVLLGNPFGPACWLLSLYLRFMSPHNHDSVMRGPCLGCPISGFTSHWMVLSLAMLHCSAPPLTGQ